MKLKQGLIVSALAVFALLVGVLPAVAQTTTRCTGTVSGEIRANVVVPPAQICYVEDATLTGNVTVGRNSDLYVTDSTVNGNVVVRELGYLDVIGTAVNGSVALNSAFGLNMDTSGAAGSLTGNFIDIDDDPDDTIEQIDQGFAYLFDSDVRSDLRVSEGEAYLEGARITGDVSTEGTEYTDFFDSVLYSDVSVSGVENGSLVCGSEFDGHTRFVDGAELLQIGIDDAPFADCAYNVMSGDVDILDNTADIQVANNTIRGNLNCEGNDPAPVLGPNRLRGEGTGQCGSVDNVNAAQQDATARLFSDGAAAATDRGAAIKAKIAERRAEAGFTAPTVEEQVEAEQFIDEARAADAEAAPEPAPARVEGRPLPSRSGR